MKLGLVADVHEYDQPLGEALKQLTELGAERLVFLGDFCSMADNLEPTCKILNEYQVEGVWGNHDYGLCEDARNGLPAKYGVEVNRFAARLKPRILLDRLHFSHVEPWLDHDNVEDLWYLGGLPETEQCRLRIFGSQDWDIAFAGHFHRWLHVTQDGITDWEGTAPLDLSVGRHYVIINACFKGFFALFDTETKMLTPLECSIGDPATNNA